MLRFFLALVALLLVLVVPSSGAMRRQISSGSWSPSSPAAPATNDPRLLGDQAIENSTDGGRGRSEAFGYTATTSGIATDAEVYLDSTSGVTIGLYADNAAKPEARLDVGTVGANNAGWVDVPLRRGVVINAGTRYWIDIAATSTRARIAYRDQRSSGSNLDYLGTRTQDPFSIVRQRSSNPASAYINDTTGVTPPPPTAAFTITPNPAIADQPATFDASSNTCNATPCSYRWTDPADGQNYSTAQSFSYTFHSLGGHQVKLVITDKLGQTDTLTKSFNVVSAPPPNPVPPSNTSPPTMSGTPQSGQTLTADPGTWTGDTPMTFAYQWSGGKTGKTDTLTDADVGTTIFVTVTASNDATPPTVSATSASVGPVTAAATQNLNCAPTTSSQEMTNTLSHTCGFADTTNTGVPAGTTLYRVPQDITAPRADGSTGHDWTWTGSYIRIATPGALITNIRVSGPDVSVNANNATIQDSDFASVNGWSIALRHVTGTIIQNNNFHGVGNVIGSNACDQAVRDIYTDADNTTIKNNNVWWCSNAFNNIDGGGLIQNNYVHNVVLATAASHAEPLHIEPGTNNHVLSVKDNTFLNAPGQTAAIIFSNDSGPAVTNVTIDHNLLAGGGYCFYGGNPPPQTPSSNITFSNNHFSRIYFPKCGQFGSHVYWNGPGNNDVWSQNIWDDTGAIENP